MYEPHSHPAYITLIHFRIHRTIQNSVIKTCGGYMKMNQIWSQQEKTQIYAPSSHHYLNRFQHNTCIFSENEHLSKCLKGKELLRKDKESGHLVLRQSCCKAEAWALGLLQSLPVVKPGPPSDPPIRGPPWCLWGVLGMQLFSKGESVDDAMAEPRSL